METPTPIRIATIEQAISRVAEVTIDDMRSHKRNRPMSEARMAVWYIAKDHMGFSYPRIAKIYTRDHTTIMSGVRKMRSQKVSKKILDGIKKICPEVLEKQAPGEAKIAENWKF